MKENIIPLMDQLKNGVFLSINRPPEVVKEKIKNPKNSIKIVPLKPKDTVKEEEEGEDITKDSSTNNNVNNVKKKEIKKVQQSRSTEFK